MKEMVRKDISAVLFVGVLPLPCQSKSMKAGLFFISSLMAFFILVLLMHPMASISPKLGHPFRVWPKEAVSLLPSRIVQPGLLNETLLAHALTDLSEPAERRQIRNILDGTWGTSSYVAYHRFVNRLEREVYDRVDKGGRPARRRERIPLQLTSPRYASFWPQFRSSLQKWLQSKNFDPHIMKHLLQHVKDTVDKHYKSKGLMMDVEEGKPYRSCAVVGNSGILLNGSYAELIDSHAMVVRLNNARTAGFERYVGTKTTMSFVNSNILTACARRARCFCHPYGDHVPLVMYICQVVHFMDVALCDTFHQAPILVMDPRFDMLCARIVKYYSLRNFVLSTGKHPEEWTAAHDGPMFHYSSGMQAVTLALGICERVSLFGFGKSDSAKHHYHSNQKGELHLHDYAAEYQFYHDLANGKSDIIPFLSDSGLVIPPLHIYL